MFRALRGMMRAMRHEAYRRFIAYERDPRCVPRPRPLSRRFSSFDGVHPGEYRDVLPFTLPRLRD